MARDYSLSAIVPPPGAGFVEKDGELSVAARLFLESVGIALFGETGESDVTQGIGDGGVIELGVGTTGNYVAEISGDPTKGLSVAGGAGEGTTNAITLAQDIQPSASPTFANISITPGGTVDGRDVSADGTALDALPATIAGKVAKTTIAALPTSGTSTVADLEAKINEIIAALA